MNLTPAATKTIMALDVGSRRIGVALANDVARLPQPFTTLDAATALPEIEQLIRQQNISDIVVGLPRGLSGQTTDQTRFTQSFIRQLEKFNLPIHTQDEAVTSAQAEAELKARKKPYSKGDIDALAATYILEDFLRDSEGVSHV
jgi:putative Holliday junction resolvase